MVEYVNGSQRKGMMTDDGKARQLVDPYPDSLVKRKCSYIMTVNMIIIVEVIL